MMNRITEIEGKISQSRERLTAAESEQAELRSARAQLVVDGDFDRIAASDRRLAELESEWSAIEERLRLLGEEHAEALAEKEAALARAQALASQRATMLARYRDAAESVAAVLREVTAADAVIAEANRMLGGEEEAIPKISSRWQSTQHRYLVMQWWEHPSRPRSPSPDSDFVAISEDGSDVPPKPEPLKVNERLEEKPAQNRRGYRLVRVYDEEHPRLRSREISEMTHEGIMRTPVVEALLPGVGLHDAEIWDSSARKAAEAEREAIVEQLAPTKKPGGQRRRQKAA